MAEAAGFLGKRGVEIMAALGQNVNVPLSKLAIDAAVGAKSGAARGELATNMLATEGERRGALAALADDRERERANRELAFEQERTAAQQRLEQARRDYEEAQEKAGEAAKEMERKAAERLRGRDGEEGGEDDDMMGAVGKRMRTSARGTFNPEAVRGLAGGGAAEEVEELTREQRRFNAKVERFMDKTGRRRNFLANTVFQE
jgi:hypothetical protein